MPLPDDNELDKLLTEREEIDRALLQRHSRELAVLFTDIVGSTQYFESRGDIAGLRLVRQHNELLLPLVTRHRGRVIKTIGDAIMAAFDQPADAVRCAAAMQRALADENPRRAAAGAEPIHIRIGAHAGRAMLAEGDVFGDTVNTAARVAHEAGGDEILLSDSLFAAVPTDEGFTAIPRGALSLKGKAAPLPVVALEWRGPAAARPIEAPAPEALVLELGLGPTGVRVAVRDAATDQDTVRSYSELPATRADLDALAARFGAFMHGDGAASYLAQVRALGAELFETALSPLARQRLCDSRLGHLRLELDEALVHLPWELMHDGQDLLGLRFATGRLISARDPGPVAAPPRIAAAAGPRHALVVSNPSGDLPDAAREGDAVAGLLRQGYRGEVRHLAGRVTRAEFLAALRGCRLLHFAGHALPAGAGSAGGFVLADAVATPADLAEAISGAPPALIFANACSSSTGAPWPEQTRDAGSHASALLLHGVPHYVAPMWGIPDADALPIALRFYERALSGEAFGEALRGARRALMEARGGSLAFAGYVLYGDPRVALAADAFCLRGGQRMRSQTGESPAAPGLGAASSSASIAPAAVEAASGAKPRRPAPAASAGTRLLGKAIGIAVLAVLVGAVIAGFLAPGGRGGSRSPSAASSAAAPTAVDPTAVDPSRRDPAAVGPAAVAPTAAAVVAEPAAAMKREGPVRIAILPFKNLTGDAQLDVLSLGLGETMTTDLAAIPGVQLIEHGEVDTQIDYLELVQTRYFDPGQRAGLGRIVGAELVVLGAFQKVNGRLLLVARLVDAETGEVRDGVRIEGAERDVFELQEQLGARVSASIGKLKEKLRP